MILLTPQDLTIASLLVLMVAAATWIMRVNLHWQILIAAFRTVVQLLLLGLILKVIFALTNPVLIGLMVLFMLITGGREIFARQSKRFRGLWGMGIGMSSLFVSSFSVTLFTLLLIINNSPWYAPQYAIPLLGMILGNTMTGISLGMERLIQTTWEQKDLIEQRLLLGHTSREAILTLKRNSTKSALIPIINSMSTAGIVSLPGMMTGQILAGSPPVEAVKYQILIMFMIASGTGFGIIFALWLTSKRMFDSRDRLRLDRLSAKGRG